ncbi:MAG: hypothetical protein ACTHMY_03485 [Solirubrobacteraceae bacterium]
MKKKEPDKMAQAIGAGGGAFIGTLVGGPLGTIVGGLFGHWLVGEASRGGF